MNTENRVTQDSKNIAVENSEAKQIIMLSRNAAICLVWLCVLIKCFFAFCDPNGTTNNLLGTLRPSLYTTHGLESQFSRSLVVCMRHGAACLTVLSYLVSFWPQLIQLETLPQPETPEEPPVIVKKSRAIQTNGPYLKRYRHGIRQLMHVQEVQHKQMKSVAMRRRKIWNRFSAMEKTSYKDIIAKEKLSGYLQTQILPLEQSALQAQQLVKVLREKLDQQREENKNIQEALDKYVNKNQLRQTSTPSCQ
ncbi:uncharacterized protein LOC121381400 [Gigantopelta aegis]|uniref:uncharacterized protein LOC121381400 n=1 Tax=Gigantopelta aegis TaxID=1735272 RepID=UPI001B88AC71|nr:uncharacterized protein LOC121381400 [Gigantopelta aegis]